MVRYIIKRILILIPVFICITIMLFGVTKLMPGDPVRAMLPSTLKAEQYDAAYEAMHKKMGLDKSLPEQYIRWMANMFTGEFGWSTNYNKPVINAVAEPIRNTIIMNIGVIIFSLLIGIPVGVACAVKKGGLFDNFWQVFSLVMWAMPSFFLALCLIYLFATKLGWLPFGGMPNTSLLSGMELFLGYVKHLILPTIVLVLIGIAGEIRTVRVAMLDAFNQDYIRTARAKGLREKVVIWSHAMRNAMIPISGMVIAYIFSLFSGSTITETIFAWNGIGRVLISSVTSRDTQMVTTMNSFFAMLSLVCVLIQDIVYCLVDPRVKLS